MSGPPSDLCKVVPIANRQCSLMLTGDQHRILFGGVDHIPTAIACRDWRVHRIVAICCSFSCRPVLCTSKRHDRALRYSSVSDPTIKECEFHGLATKLPAPPLVSTVRRLAAGRRSLRRTPKGLASPHLDHQS
jgi:hypothetical protein